MRSGGNCIMGGVQVCAILTISISPSISNKEWKKFPIRSEDIMTSVDYKARVVLRTILSAN